MQSASKQNQLDLLLSSLLWVNELRTLCRCCSNCQQRRSLAEGAHRGNLLVSCRHSRAHCAPATTACRHGAVVVGSKTHGASPCIAHRCTPRAPCASDADAATIAATASRYTGARHCCCCCCCRRSSTARLLVVASHRSCPGTARLLAVVARVVGVLAAPLHLRHHSHALCLFARGEEARPPRLHQPKVGRHGVSVARRRRVLPRGLQTVCELVRVFAVPRFRELVLHPKARQLVAVAVRPNHVRHLLPQLPVAAPRRARIGRPSAFVHQGGLPRVLRVPRGRGAEEAVVALREGVLPVLGHEGGQTRPLVVAVPNDGLAAIELGVRALPRVVGPAHRVHLWVHPCGFRPRREPRVVAVRVRQRCALHAFADPTGVERAADQVELVVRVQLCQSLPPGHLMISAFFHYVRFVRQPRFIGLNVFVIASRKTAMEARGMSSLVWSCSVFVPLSAVLVMIQATLRCDRTSTRTP
mmetsp:Transcript_46201/g.93243  ORF Transcript_46201/g.93243 Transcript_46201/m.93243 type:complete len:471 (-) Transcript_46201:112-1524(-)